MDKNKVFEMFDLMRGNMYPGQMLEPFSVAATLDYLDINSEASPNYITRLSRAGETVIQELYEILEEIKNKHPYFEDVFEELDAFNKMTVSSLSRFWFIFSSSKSEGESTADWFDQIIEIYDTNRGHRMGDGSTSPNVINEIATSILRPVEGTFHDGMAGFGGSLKYAARYAKQHGGTLNLFGQEVSSKSWAISKVRLFIDGFEDAEIRKGDIFSKPVFREENRLKKFDYVFIDSPFGMEISQYDAVQSDKFNRFLYGMPPKRNSELATISHIIASLKENGKGMIVVSSGTLFRSGTEEQIRKNIISTDIVEAVIALPGGLYNNTLIPSNLILFNKNKDEAKKEKILFINAEEQVTEVNRREKTIPKKAIQQIVETVASGEEISGYSKIVSINDIQEGNIVPNRYVFTAEMIIEKYGKVEFSMDRLEDIETRPLEDMVTFFRGYNATSKNESPEGQYKVLKISDVQGGDIIRAGASTYNVENNTKVEAYRLQKGDVIVSVRGQAIKVAEVNFHEDNFLLSQNFMGIRCGKDLNPTYLKIYMESPVGQYLLSSRLTGSVIPTLNKNDLKSLPVPVISVDEQNKLVELYRETEIRIKDEIEKLRTELLDSKIDAYEAMGLGEVFTIKK